MGEEIIRIESVSQFCALASMSKPTHPLIYVAKTEDWEITEEQLGLKFALDLYGIGLKDGNCGMQYGRNTYDFEEGVMYFTAPNQVTSVTKAQQKNEVKGWVIYFHPDLIRNTHLGKIIDHYSFFSYAVFEALHLSEQEQDMVKMCISNIQQEISQRIDNQSNNVIVSSLQLLLDYSQRYYERQFNTRTAQNKDILSQIDDLLKRYFQDGQFSKTGIPSVHYLGEQLSLSAHYLSDVLKKETGRSAKEHINDFIVEKAKLLLLSSTDSVSEIAYDLGFNYPHYFSRLFKSKTGITPQAYRQVN